MENECMLKLNHSGDGKFLTPHRIWISVDSRLVDSNGDPMLCAECASISELESAIQLLKKELDKQKISARRIFEQK